MQSKVSKAMNSEITVWISPVGATWYEPALIFTYDRETVALRSRTNYADGQEILIGLDLPLNKNGAHGIEALLRARIFRCLQVEKESGTYFEYCADNLSAVNEWCLEI